MCRTTGRSPEKADGQHRPSLRTLVADRRAIRTTGEFRSADHDPLYPSGKQQDLPLPPNFAAAFPNVKVSRGQVTNYLVPWDKLDFGPRIGLAYQLTPKTVIRAGYGIFYGGEENQGGSPNRGEGIPFNETVQFNRTPGIVSSFIGISDQICTSCQYMPGGLTGGFPASPFTLNARFSSAAFSRTSAIRWFTSGT